MARYGNRWKGYVRVRVGTDLVLMDGRTGVIKGVFKDIAL